MLKRTFALLAAVALMGAGCWGYSSTDVSSGAGTSGGNGSAEEPKGMEGGADASAEVMASVEGSWKMTMVKKAGQAAQNVASSNFTLTLDSEGKLGAKICNSMSGGYSIEDGKLQSAEVISTLMFCPGLPGDVEVAFTADLTAGLSVSRAGNVLTLTGASGTVYTFEKS